MKNELIRRLNILKNKKISPIYTKDLRSEGMQGRLRRQGVLNHNKNIKKQKNEIKKQLSLIEQQERIEESGGFGVLSAGHVEELEDFNEPILRSMRSKRGFF